MHRYGKYKKGLFQMETKENIYEGQQPFNATVIKFYFFEFMNKPVR
jgi:hypothetical protein